jgi:hypothetical protein
MSSLHLSALTASLLILTAGAAAAGCASSEVPPASGSGAQTASPTKDTGSSGSTGTTAPAASSTGSSSQVPTVPPKDQGTPCGQIIGKWAAAIDDGAQASGDDIPLGQSIPIGGSLNFTLTHDDADIANVVDFTGTATISAMGSSQTYDMKPATQTTGDQKDTTCAGGLHIKGVTNVDPIGNILFTMDGDFDDTGATPNKGHANFTMKTADDNGKAMTASGTAHITRQTQ